MRLGRAITIIRAAEGKTQADTAAEIGLSPQVLSRLESGKGCEAQSLVRILAWLCETPEPSDDQARLVSLPPRLAPPEDSPMLHGDHRAEGTLPNEVTA